MVEGTRDSRVKQTIISQAIDFDPLIYKEAMKSQDAAFWKKVINDEMNSMKNKTWKLVDLPHLLVANGSSKGRWKLMELLINSRRVSS